MPFRAFVVNKSGDATSSAVMTLGEEALPAGEVTIRVAWSSFNYKDGLACTPGNRIVRSYPMTPGIDLAGTVTASAAAQFKVGDQVLVTGYDLGVAHPGGFAETARVPAAWVVPLPAGMSMKEAMAIGTAGFTAAMSVDALQQHGVTPASGPVLVAGATGGVGSTAVSMLAGLGYTVAGSTGKGSEHEFLRGLGATEILSREEVSAESSRPLESERWAGAIDPVGAATTAYILRTLKYGGAVALSGLAGGTAVGTTVMPFILRGVNLLGIDSVNWPMAPRLAIWKRLAGDLKPRGLLESIAYEATLEDIPALAAQILAGQVRGRALIRLSGE